ncbi:ptype atpase [Phytophthora cinnamomi]|uniref:ptype atpase n=1 Tax=Phytophthora cinnamomi TaxID=4785 RepID=UPI00355A912B|nr:ptype atpase [Phytophthora cinnamomi]
MSLSARTHSATSRSSSNNLIHGGGGSRRYRRVAHKPQVDDTLFGEKSQLLKNRKNDRTLQAGRDIVGTHSRASSNQEGGGHEGKSTFGGQPGRRAGKRVVTKPQLVVVPEDELERIRAETKILTPADIEALEAKREADQEYQRLTSKARKEHMLKLSEETAQRAPKSEIEQMFSAEKHEILRRAQVLKDQMHDSVKLMKTLGTRAQAFTIRDQQLKVKKELEDEHHVYDEKMNTLMEIERLESLKRQEHRDEVKKQKRYADRKVLEEQIEDRRRQRQKESEIIAQEAQEMLAKIQRQQEEAAEKEKAKALRAQRSMEEIKKFNDETLFRKQDVQRKIKEEEDQVLAYQQKKAEDLKRREEEEAQRRHEAELRCAKLRSMQEKMANEKAELDELRAKRAAEARERQAREADLASARKQKEEMDELRRARNAQALHRERARVKEATLQQREYESIMMQVESDKARVKAEDEKRKFASMAHRRVLQSQIEEKEHLKKFAFVKKQEEGQALKEEFAQELAKLEQIRMEEVGELVEAGVNPLYLSEMKALVIEKQIR